jgi:curli production assembly/transport component CsgF
MRAVCFLLLALGLGLTGLAPSVAAQDLLYRPVNPAFGGSPLNHQWLTNSAQIQNAFEPESRSSFRRDPLENFESGLQRQILSQLSRELISNRFGDLDLSQEGLFDLGEFTVEVIPGLNGTSIRVFNELTGDETTVTIPNL